MKRMGIEALYRKPNTSKPTSGHEIYPHLLRNLPITRPDQVWAMDIPDSPLARGLISLTAVLDWCTRRVQAGRVSITLEAAFFAEAVDEALRTHGKPEIFNMEHGRAHWFKRPCDVRAANTRSGLLQPANARSGSGIVKAENHLETAQQLFGQSEPPLPLPHPQSMRGMWRKLQKGAFYPQACSYIVLCFGYPSSHYPFAPKLSEQEIIRVSAGKIAPLSTAAHVRL